MARVVRHPDVCAVIGHRERTFSGCKGGQHDPTRTDFHQRAITIAHHPHVHSVKQYSGSSITNRERAEVKTIRRAQLGNGLVEIVCDPNVLALGRNAKRATPDSVRSHHCSCSAEPGNGFAVVIRYPDTAARIRQAHRVLAGRKRSEVSSGLAEFGYGVAVSISDPDVGAVEGESTRTITGSVGAENGAGRWIEFRNVIAQQVSCPDSGTGIE